MAYIYLIKSFKSDFSGEYFEDVLGVYRSKESACSALLEDGFVFGKNPDPNTPVWEYIKCRFREDRFHKFDFIDHDGVARSRREAWIEEWPVKE